MTFLSNSERLWGLDLTDCKVDADGFINTAFVDLNLDCTSIDSTFAGPSKTLKVYDTLSMDRTEITDAVLPNICNGKIWHLKLGETQITEQGLSGLGVDGLTELSLNSRKFTGSCFETWKPNLDVLNLSHSGVSDAVIKEILKLPRLHSLSLSDTEVTDACLEALSQSTLICISLSGTRVTSAGLLRQNWGNKSISIAANQFTEPEFKMLLKHGQFTVMPPVCKRP